jgi:uncharacterized repeat protein (TIGR02543 family)
MLLAAKMATFRRVVRRALHHFLALVIAVSTLSAISVAKAPEAIAANTGPCQQTFSTSGATGSVDVTLDGGYCYIAFKNTGAVNSQTIFSWTRPAGLNAVDVLVVGGGGSGGARHGGGGGGGGFVQTDSFAISGSTISIAVGAGGDGSTSYTGTPGQTSYFKPTTSSTNGLIALGGGAGVNGDIPGKNGGSGGGSGWNQSAGTVTSQTQSTFAGTTISNISSGSVGAAGASDSNVSESLDYWAGGGGGGAAGAGAWPTYLVNSTRTLTNAFPTGTSGSAIGGAGGGGKSVSWITPTIAAANALNIGHTVSSTVYFAGGGGGGMGADGQAGGPGGLGGGAAGSRVELTGNAGMAFTGGGGGGSGFDDIQPGAVNAADAGDGGSGIVVIRYQIQPAAPTITGITGGNNSLSVAFTAPTGGSTVTGYKFSSDGGSTWSASTSSTSSPISITGLTNGTSYAVQIRAVNSYWDGVATASTNAIAGTTCTPTADLAAPTGFTVLTFTNTTSCNWSVPTGVTAAEILVVGGGGGAGSGGGGAGGFLTETRTGLSGVVQIVVGSGGAQSAGTNLRGSNGGTSSFGDRSAGGGGGGGRGTQAIGSDAPTGVTQRGSGGGAAASSSAGKSAGATRGGDTDAGRNIGGGGGGAGADGVGNNSGAISGNGGVGLQSSITGTSTYYAGGGRGAEGGSPGLGYDQPGGGASTSGGFAAQNGVVIVKYVNPPSISLSTTTISAIIGSAVTSYSISNSSGPAASFAISPSLAVSGLSFSTSTGLISGTPTAAASSTNYTITATNTSGTSTATFSLASSLPVCSPTSVSAGAYTTLTFTSTSTCSWSVPAGVTAADVLVVGGGGGGAGTYSTGPAGSGGGGGGGGAYLANAVPLTPSATFQVRAGNGGAGGSTTSNRPGSEGSQGGDSAFGTLTAGGGGGGGCATTSSNNEVCTNSSMAGRPGTAGGSGGGATPPWNAFNWGAAGSGSSVTIGGTTFAAQTGYIGAVYLGTANSNAGGAGSGGGARSAATTSAVGSGLSTDFAGGSAVEYGRGGRGSNQSGTTFNATTSGYGNGGDGAVVASGAGAAGATGAQGVVIVRYLNVPSISLSTSTINAVVGSAISSYTISNSGGAASSYSISPSLATNGTLAFSTSTGLLSGTPTSTASSATYTITATNSSGTSTATFSISSSHPSCSPSTSSAGGFTIIQFQTVGTCAWSVPTGVTSVDILVVGGGGAGGALVGGGGGAGGYLHSTSVSVTPGANNTITVGAGGVASSSTAGGNGGNSAFNDSLIAIGGGGGGTAAGSTDVTRGGSNGGSGGGASTTSVPNGTSPQAGTGTTGQGNSGGLSFLLGTSRYNGGGGGGSSGAGVAAAETAGGKGGSGTLNSISGTAVCYATGGGGALYSGSGTSGAGGDCGTGANPNGGSGAVTTVSAATTVTANRGGGGGGGARAASTWTTLGSNGGSGVVIVRYVNGEAAAAAITTQPTGAASGSLLGTQPVVRIVDAAGNTVTSSTVSVVASIASGGGTLSGTTSVAAVNGVATFTNLVITGTSGNRTLTFTPTSLTAVTSSAITISAGAASQVAITRASVGTQRRTAFTTQPQITVQDSSGNTVTSSSAVVTATVSAGGTLVGTTTATASSGVATFTGLGVDGTIGTTYTITYTVSGLTVATATVTLSNTTCDGSFTCQVGDIGPGGGRIFYVAPTFFTQEGASGSMCTTNCKYLEAAPTSGTNAWGATTDSQHIWSGNTNTAIGTTARGTAVGTGYANTLAIVGQSSTSSRAATSSRAYRGPNNLSDWFLPSRDEFNQMCKWQKGITGSDLTTLGTVCTGSSMNTGIGAAGFTNAWAYWTSTERDATNAQYQYMSNGAQGWDLKSYNFYVRPVRAFGPAPIAISEAAIAGVTAPVAGATPVTTTTAGTGYTGTVTWSGSPTTFATGTIYTATITLTATAGYTLTGVSENFFTVAGATTDTNSANSGVVTAVFPATASSSVATLSALTLTTATLSPDFSSGTTSYTASVVNTTSSITVTPTRTQANATITVNGTAVTSGSASGAISLSVGSNTITVVVTAQDGTTTATYTITVTRAAGAVAPTIGTQPTAAAKTVGQSVTFTVAASKTDAGTLSYQWQKLISSTWTNIASATSTSYTFTTTATSDAGDYRVIVTNTLSGSTATATSNVVALTMSGALSITTPSGLGLQGSYNSAFSLTVSASGGAGSNAFTATGSLPTGVTISSAGVISGTPSIAGNFSLTVTVTDANSATATTSSFTIAIAKGTSTVSLTIPSFTFTGSPQGPDVNDVTKTGSTGAVTFAYVGRDGTSYPSSSTKPTNVGTYTVTATVAADDNFATVSASGNFAITNASLVITPTISASSMVFGTSSGLPTISHSKNPNVTLTTNPTCTLHLASDTGFTTARTINSSLAVGSYVVRCTGAALTNYTITYGTNPSFSVTKANQATISSPVLSATSKTFPYSQTSLSVNSVTGGSGDGALSITSVVDGTATGCTWSGSTLTSSTSGTCTLTITKAASASYEAATASATFTFNKATPTFNSWSNVTKSYTDTFTVTSPVVVGSVSGTFSYSSATTSVIGVSGTTLSADGVGTSVITATFTPTSTTDYNTATTTMTVTVNKASQTMAWTPTTSLLVTDSPVTFAAATALDSAVITYQVTGAGTTGCSVNSSTRVLTFSAAGSCMVLAQAAATDRYILTSISQTFTITLSTRTLTIDSGSFTSTYGMLATPPTLTSTASAGTGTKSYTSSTASVCTVNSSSGLVAFVAPGTCTLAASIAATSAHSSATASSISFAVTSSTTTLSSLVLTTATLSPTFASATTSYTASVLFATTALTVTSTRTQSDATITVNGTAVNSGSASESISLNVGSNTITVVVTAQDGVTTRTYTVTVTRAVQVFTITYAAGTGGSGTGPTSPTTVNSGATFTTPANTYTRTLYTFAGWSDGTNTFAAGATYPSSGSVSGNVTLTATWNLDACSSTTSTANGYTSIVITTVGTCGWVVPDGITNVDVLAVGGGGAGGTSSNGAGGGGGGGQVNAQTNTSVSGVITIQVGAGGSPQATASATPGGNGGTTSFTPGSGSAITANGGSGGASVAVNAVGSPSATGFNGGGGSVWANSLSVTNGTNGVGGFKGGASIGSGTDANIQAAGGGGGSAAAGANAASTIGGNGGAGVSNSYSGTATLYGGGGGGGKRTSANGSAGSGGSGGGGNGGRQANGSAGTANTGGGGGGAGGENVGGAGGSGVVIVRYATIVSYTYDANGGTGTAPSGGSVRGATTFTTEANPFTRTGYSFAGWNTAANGSGTALTANATNTMPASGTSIVFYAQWTAASLVVTYDEQGGGSIADGSVNVGASISAAPTAPVRAGYTLSGWSTTSSGSVVTFPYAHGETANFTLYAIWTANSLTVTYNSKGGTAVSSGTVNTAASISSAPTAPTRTGYTFSAWSATDGGTAITFPYAHGQTANFTLFALWTAGSLVVTYDAKGGSSVSNGSTSSGASISSAPTAPTRTGYTLDGWSATETGTVVVFPYAHGQTANFTLYAKWTGTTNTITYDSKSGTSVANGSFVTGGSIASAPTAPTRAGYTLSGWSLTDGGSVITYPYSPVATSGITLYAIWAAISCSPTSATTGGYTIYTFTTVGTCFWTVPDGVTGVEILAIAGGGGGGYSYDNSGAGGGAGGQLKTGTATLSTTLEVTVGAGGAAGISTSQRGGTGANSVVSTITALGGTGGCASRATTCSNSAQATSSAAANGGIGGAGGASGRGGGGSNTTGSSTSSTTGGVGTASSFSGTSVTYGVGGSGGTARGASTNIAGTAGSANTGNGGGGASAKSSSGDVNGGAGGSGLVVVRVASALTVTYDSQSGSDVAAGSTVTGGSIATAPTDPTRTNYTFLGWFTATTGGSAISFPYAHGQTANFTLYARWNLNTYAITFNTNNGTGSMGNQSFTHGVAFNLNANLYTRANYVFHRWATNADGTGTTYNNLAQVTLTAATTLYAQWTANTYVVTYNYNDATGGNSTATASFTTAGSAIVLPTPTKTGFTFAGWYSDSGLSSSIGSAGANYLPTGATLSLNAYAKWTAVNYTFTYNSNSADEGTVPTETSKQITQTATVKANTGGLVRTGYTFGGWNTQSNGSGDNYLSGSLFTVGSSNVTLYAKWTANTYTVTYNVNGGSGNAQRNVSSVATNVTSDSYTTGGASVVLPNVGTLARSGYTFDGWNTSAAGTGTNYAAADNYTTVSNVIFYAKWNPVTYSITYNGNTSDGGSAPTTGGYTTGQASPYSVLANTFTKTSNVFGGWNTAANGTGTSYSPGATITTLANIVLYATWIPQFTLHYAINGGSVSSGSLPADQLYNTGTSVGPVFSSVSRTGYTFGGWLNGATTIAANGNFTILADSVLTAKWTPINYTIAYNSDGGTEAPSSITRQIGQSYTVGAAVSKPGYNFTGWSNGSSVIGAGATIVTGSSDVTYTAQWVARIYTISYDWNGGRGTAVADVNYTFGTTAITLPLVGDRVRDGYTFAGWSESLGGSALASTYTPSQTRTLYALWNIGNFTVTYDAGRGTIANSTASVANGGNTILPLPTRANFTFNGWHTAVTGGSSVGSNGATFTPTSSQTVYARWIQNSLYGITDSLTRIGSVVTVANVANTFSGANSNSSVAVSIPANALPAGTTINFDLVGSSTRATGIITGINYLVSIALSWLTGDETVPDTASDKPISVTISNATIKAGAAAYAIVNNVSTLLGTATQDGVITVAITADPEIVVAAVKPGAPTNVAATSNGNQQSVISWSAPASDGGSAITGYTVTAAPGGGTCTTSTTSCTISGLTNGTAYTFTVIATNGVGPSVASTSASATTAALYAVTFDAKSGTAVTNGSFLTASTVSEPTAPTRTGYSFAGWSATDGGSALVFPYAPGVTTAITLYARWDALDNAVTFDSKSGSDVTASVFSSGGTVAEPTAPTRSGYTFAGWSATDGGTAVTFPYAPGVVTDITLYAKWTIVSQNNSSGSGGGSSTPAPSEPAVPSTPVKSNVTVVAPVTVVGDQDAKVIAVDIAIPTPGSNAKPPVIKIDKASEKFIAEVKVVEGKLVLTPETGFSGKKTVSVTITENGADRIIQIPLTVLPEAVTKPVLTPTASNRSLIRWTESPNADGYTVFLNGKRVCTTTALSCSVKTILGPDANIEIVSNGGDRTVSQRVDAEFRQNVPVPITRLVSATITKATLTRVDTKALDQVVALIKNQGFGTVVISEITTTSKTKALAAARIESIKKYITSKIGAEEVEFEITPVKSRTYFNNISVKG